MKINNFISHARNYQNKNHQIITTEMNLRYQNKWSKLKIKERIKDKRNRAGIN